MSRFEPTAAQQKAIELRGSSVLVSAAAGSGKTRVVTERVLSAILDPAEPASIQEFLIITFTKAAATELKSRIGHAIQETMREHPGERRLKEQHLLCPQASIGTIHSFCQNILREHSHALGIAPDFRVLDEDRAAMMKQSAMERIMERSSKIGAIAVSKQGTTPFWIRKPIVLPMFAPSCPNLAPN